MKTLTLTITTQQAADIRDALQIVACNKKLKDEAYAATLVDLAFLIDELKRQADK